MGLSLTVAKRAPMPARRAVRTVRRARRSAFETVGSERYSAVAAGGMDRALVQLLGRDGTFCEAGANDGIRYSNTYLLERFYGWRGVLVEAIPSLYRDCVRNRPNATVIHAALSAKDGPATVMLSDQDLTSQVVDNGTVEVRTSTLSAVLDRAGIGRLDLLSLDVEGHEENALLGLDLDRHAPRYVLMEVWGYDERAERLEKQILRGLYEPMRWLTALDLLYRLRD